MSDKLVRTQEIVGGLLTEIAFRFRDPRLTLVVRSPALEAEGKDPDFVMTDDDLDEAISALQRRKAARARTPDTGKETGR